MRSCPDTDIDPSFQSLDITLKEIKNITHFTFSICNLTSFKITAFVILPAKMADGVS